MRAFAVLLAFACFAPTLAPSPPTLNDPKTYTAQPVSSAVEKLISDVSVGVFCGNYIGSGVVVLRTNDDCTIDRYIWTAGHVVAHVREGSGLLSSKPATFGTMYVSQTKLVGTGSNIVTWVTWRCTGTVVKFSKSEDLALLKLTGGEIEHFSAGASFYLGTNVLTGRDLCHMGNYLGIGEAEPFTEGFYGSEQILLSGKQYDSVLVEAYPGSSGGGVFLQTNGDCAGLVLRTAGPPLQFIAPVRRMCAWAKKTGIEWAVDPSVPMPSTEALARLPKQ